MAHLGSLFKYCKTVELVHGAEVNSGSSILVPATMQRSKNWNLTVLGRSDCCLDC